MACCGQTGDKSVPPKQVEVKLCRNCRIITAVSVDSSHPSLQEDKESFICTRCKEKIEKKAK